MATSVHGFKRSDEFLTGEMQFCSIYTVFAIDVTGVKLTRQELVDGGWLTDVTLAAGNPITLFNPSTGADVTYTANAVYDNAHFQQANLDRLLGVVDDRAAPIIIQFPLNAASTTSPTAAIVTDFAGTELVAVNSFGTDITESTALVWAFAMATEHNLTFDNLAADLDGLLLWVTDSPDVVEAITDSEGGAVVLGDTATVFTATAATNNLIVTTATSFAGVGVMTT